MPPAAKLINSPYDVETRISKKRDMSWSGTKVHFTETCDDDLPHLILHVLTTPATTTEGATHERIHADLAQTGRLPWEHLLDAGYVEGQLIVDAREQYGIEIVGRAPGSPSWQAKAQNGFDMNSFSIDWEQQRVTCPAGQTSVKWSPTFNCDQQPIINIRFPDQACRICTHHAQYTKSAGARNLTLRPRAPHEALQTARRRQTTPEFQARYNRRAGIEGTFTQADRLCGLPRSRYIGSAKTHLQHVLTALALNLRRLFAWLEGAPLAKTRVAPFVQLMPVAG